MNEGGPTSYPTYAYWFSLTNPSGGVFTTYLADMYDYLKMIHHQCGYGGERTDLTESQKEFYHNASRNS